jgi:acetylornithine deacetylase
VSEGIQASEILRELVAIASPSRVSNLPLLYWVREFLEAREWSVELLPYRDDNDVEKANLIARPAGANNDARIDIAFICHTDTVPYAANWPALELQERDGHLHGCGSCDVKGALACFLATVDELKSETIAPGMALILTADEEIGCMGMERLLASTSLKIGSAIISEPTSLQPGVAGKGYGLARITVEGREAHSAFPQKGVSAISVAARLIAAIENFFAARDADALLDLLFDPPRTSLNIGVIEGGTAKNIIPGRCSFLVEWRGLPSEKPGAVFGQLQRVVDEESCKYPDAVMSLSLMRDEKGFAPAAKGELQQKLSALLGTEPVGISFGSEASRVARIADEVIVIGPGDMRTAHSDRECVPVIELERWTAVLKQLLLNACPEIR